MNQCDEEQDAEACVSIADVSGVWQQAAPLLRASLPLRDLLLPTPDRCDALAPLRRADFIYSFIQFPSDSGDGLLPAGRQQTFRHCTSGCALLKSPRLRRGVGPPDGAIVSRAIFHLQHS